MLTLLVFACACAVGGAAAVVPSPPDEPAPPDEPVPLSMGVTNDLESVAFGEAVRYVITLRNDGMTAQRVTVRLTVPPMLDDAQITSGYPAADGLLIWPAVVPARGESTVELRARVRRTYAATNTVAVTACGLPERAQAPAICATDLDDLLVRRTSGAAALPWLAAGIALTLLAAGVAALWRRRARPRVAPE